VELDILIRGQSNAFLLLSDDLGGTARAALQAEVQRLLGFDGVTDQVHLDYDWWTPGAETIRQGTALIGDWLQPSGGGWQPVAGEQALLEHARQVSHAGAESTAILWLHNENDSQRADLTAEEWISAVRADAALLRDALGKDAAHSPYLFVSAIPYVNGTDAGHQAIRLGMEELAADPGFNAAIAARALDIDMSFKLPTDPVTPLYGGPHMAEVDAVDIAHRAARAIAEEWAAYARPGSPVALAGGDIADDGPQVVAAEHTAPDTLRVVVAQDHASGFAALDPEAAAGLGWTVRDAAGAAVAADSARILAADALELHFGATLPADGLLHYGFGYGRLAGFDQPAQGNAIYDTEGLPLWTPAGGVAISGGTASPPATPPPTAAIDWDAVAAAAAAYHEATGQW
jgi:hypothetical protein